MANPLFQIGTAKVITFFESANFQKNFSKFFDSSLWKIFCSPRFRKGTQSSFTAGLEHKIFLNFWWKILENSKKVLPLQSRLKKRGWPSAEEAGFFSAKFEKFIEKTDKISTSKYRETKNRERWFLWKLNKSVRRELRVLKDIQRRVWSWLRMNASGRLNTCKSRGSGE